MTDITVGLAKITVVALFAALAFQAASFFGRMKGDRFSKGPGKFAGTLLALLTIAVVSYLVGKYVYPLALRGFTQFYSMFPTFASLLIAFFIVASLIYGVYSRLR